MFILVNIDALQKHRAPTNDTDERDISIHIHQFYTGGVSALTGYKLETLREMCAHLNLTAMPTGKRGRIIRNDYIKALQDSTALVRIQHKTEQLTFAQPENQMKTPSLDGANVSDPLIPDTDTPASSQIEDLAMEVETTIVPAQLEVTADSRSKKRRINSGEERSDDWMKTLSLGGENVCNPLILDTEAPASPQSEDLAMKIETTIVPEQLEVTADSRSKKRKRINSGEERDMPPPRVVKKLKTANQTVTIETFEFASVPNIFVAASAFRAEPIIKDGKGDIRLH